MLDRPDDAQRQRLNLLIGTWDSTIRMLDVHGRAIGTGTALEHYRWMANGRFVIHEVEAALGSATQHTMEIVTPDGHGIGFQTRSYNADGTVSQFTVALDAYLLTISGEDLRFVGTFSPDGQRLEGQWDRLEDRVWQPYQAVLMRRRPDALPT